MTAGDGRARATPTRAIAGGIALYTAGGLFWAFLPFFVSLQIERGGLSAAAAGLLGTSYLAGFTASSMLAIWWAPRFDVRRCVLVAVLLIVGAFWLLGAASLFFIALASCFVIGLAMGALWVIAYRLFGETANPDRTFALAIGISYPALALVTLIASRLVIPHAGLGGTLLTIAILVGLLGLGGTQLPRRLAATVAEPTASPSSAVGSAGILALIGLFLTGFAFACIWSLAARMGSAAAFDEASVGAVLSSNLLLTGIGSLAASTMGGRLGRVGPLASALVLLCLCMAALLDRSSFALFAAAFIGLGFGMGVAMPFQLAAIADADKSGRLVSLIAATQGLGTALAPPLAGWSFQIYGPRSVAEIGLVSLILSLVSFLVAAKAPSGAHA